VKVGVGVRVNVAEGMGDGISVASDTVVQEQRLRVERIISPVKTKWQGLNEIPSEKSNLIIPSSNWVDSFTLRIVVIDEFGDSPTAISILTKVPLNVVAWN
jgi:hypothetical protein